MVNKSFGQTNFSFGFCFVLKILKFLNGQTENECQCKVRQFFLLNKIQYRIAYY